jgi:hypothetical protein
MKMNPLEDPQLKKSPYTVPQGYFEALPGLMRQQVENEECAMPQRLYFRPRFSMKVFRTQFALAASLILLFGLAYGGLYLATPGKIIESETLAIEEGFTPFGSYTLWEELQSEEEDSDPEDIITFLTENGISPLAVASLD